MIDLPGRTDVSRRLFVARLGTAALGITLAPMFGCETNSVAPFVEGTDIPFLTPLTDPNPDRAFYVQCGRTGGRNWPGPSQIARDAWGLAVDGLVASPRTFTYADLLRLSGNAVRIVSTLRCIVDSTFVPGLIGTALYGHPAAAGARSRRRGHREHPAHPYLRGRWFYEQPAAPRSDGPISPRTGRAPACLPDERRACTPTTDSRCACWCPGNTGTKASSGSPG